MCAFCAFFLFQFTLVATNPEVSNWIKNLSEGSPELQTGFQDFDAEVAVSGNTIHVVWLASATGGIEQLYYKRSTDNGQTWEAKQLLYEDNDINYSAWESVQQKLLVSGNYVHITIGHNLDDGGWHGVVTYLRSTNGGASFEAPKVLYNSSTYYIINNVMISGIGSNFQIAFQQNINYANEQKLIVLASTDNGATFSQNIAMTDPNGHIVNISDFKSTGNNCYFLYNESTSPWQAYNYITHVLYSNNGGVSFQNTIVSTPRADGVNHHTNALQEHNYAAKLAVDGNRVWVIWNGLNETDTQTLFVRSSSNGGATFGNALQISGTITSIQSGQETIAGKGNYVYVSFITPQGATYLCQSTDGGLSFSAPERITPAGAYNIEGSWWSQLVMDPDGEKVHFIANGGVYGVFSPDGNHRGLQYTGNWGYQDSQKPRLVFGENGMIHTVYKGGSFWLSTGVFTDFDIMYRRMNPDYFDAGTSNMALKLDILTNPGDGSGTSQFDNMTIASSPSLNFTSAMTIEFWVKPEIGSYLHEHILSTHDNQYAFGDYGSFQLRTRDGYGRQPYCVVNTETGQYVLWGSKKFIDGYWNHLAVTYTNDGSADNFKLYLNGEVIGSETTAGDISLPKALWRLGGYDDIYLSQGFQGSFEELRFWNVARSAEELKAMKYQALEGHEQGLAAYYNFDAISDDGEVSDITGHGNTGLLMYKETLIPSSLTDPDARFSFVQNVSEFFFTQLTEGAEGIQWDFGDGNTSDQINPAHVYTTPGNYQVCMTVSANENIGLACEEVFIEGIERIWPVKGGNTAGVTTLVYGGNLSPEDNFILRKSGVNDIVSIRNAEAGANVISVEFDLLDQPTGVYTLLVDNGSTTFELANAFEIVVGEKSQPWVELAGPGRVLINKWTNFTISYGNSSNVDAYAVPIWIAISDVEDIEMVFLDFDIGMPEYIIENGYEGIDSIGLEVPMDEFLGVNKSMRVYPLIIPHIPAGYSNSVRVRIKSPVKYELYVWNGTPYFQSPFSTPLSDCMISVFTEGFIQVTAGAIPVVGCITAIGSQMFGVHEDYRPKTKPTFWSQTFTWSTILLDCGINLSGVGAITKAMWTLFANMPLYANQLNDCKKAFGDPNVKSKTIETVNSFDPNEKYGPQGFAEANYIAETRQMSYQISFENMATASAPAQEVWVVDTLSSELYDLDNFAFGSAGFGDSVYFINPGIHEFGLEVDLRPEKQAIVRIEGRLDKATRLLTFHFITLDPETLDLVEDAFGGFLPPNVTAPEGEGFVTFTVGLLDNIQHEDVVENQASIFFDANAPILTNNFLNTFDLEAPSSTLSIDNPVSTDTTLLITLQGTDDGAGIRYYEVYVSENDGEYLLYSIEEAEEFLFTGSFGGSYKCYSVAIDSVGNKEEVPASPDAEVTIVTDIDDLAGDWPDFRVTPVPARDHLLIDFLHEQGGNVRCSIIDLAGKEVMVLADEYLASGHHQLRRAINLMPGIYLVHLHNGARNGVRKIVIEQ